MVNDILEDGRQNRLVLQGGRSGERAAPPYASRDGGGGGGIASRGHQRAGVRRIKIRIGTPSLTEREKAKDTDQEVLPPVGVLLKGRMQREPEEVQQVRMISLRVL